MNLFIGKQLREREDAPFWNSFAEVQRRFNAAVESHLRAELWRLRTHRLNVVRVVDGSPTIVQVGGDGKEWVLSQRTGLRRLLPPGPRPLP